MNFIPDPIILSRSTVLIVLGINSAILAAITIWTVWHIILKRSLKIRMLHGLALAYLLTPTIDITVKQLGLAVVVPGMEWAGALVACVAISWLGFLEWKTSGNPLNAPSKSPSCLRVDADALLEEMIREVQGVPSHRSDAVRELLRLVLVNGMTLDDAAMHLQLAPNESRRLWLCGLNQLKTLLGRLISRLDDFMGRLP